jgi:cytochrome c5
MKRLVIAAGIVVLSLAAQAEGRKVDELYAKTCAMCHANQGTGAPLTGDAAAWEPRLKQGMDVLVKHATDGIRAMPPKGMCFDCTADEFKALITFMSTPKK